MWKLVSSIQVTTNGSGILFISPISPSGRYEHPQRPESRFQCLSANRHHRRHSQQCARGSTLCSEVRRSRPGHHGKRERSSRRNRLRHASRENSISAAKMAASSPADNGPQLYRSAVPPAGRGSNDLAHLEHPAGRRCKRALAFRRSRTPGTDFDQRPTRVFECVHCERQRRRGRRELRRGNHFRTSTSIAEFRILTSNFDAEYGGHSGGTNQRSHKIGH